MELWEQPKAADPPDPPAESDDLDPDSYEGRRERRRKAREERRKQASARCVCVCVCVRVYVCVCVCVCVCNFSLNFRLFFYSCLVLVLYAHDCSCAVYVAARISDTCDPRREYHAHTVELTIKFPFCCVLVSCNDSYRFRSVCVSFPFRFGCHSVFVANHVCD